MTPKEKLGREVVEAARAALSTQAVVIRAVDTHGEYLHWQEAEIALPGGDTLKLVFQRRQPEAAKEAV